MAYVSTIAYQTLLARACDGEAVDLVPATLALGDGHYNSGTGELSEPTPYDTALEQATVSGLAVTLTRYGHTLRVEIVVDGSVNPGTYTEAGVFLTDATAVIFDSFRPVVLSAGISMRLSYTLFPEVP